MRWWPYVGLLTLADMLRDRGSLWWVDNDAARYAVIKGSSPSVTMRHLVRSVHHLEASSPTHSWIERIPSLSNPADGPSRGDPTEAMSLLGIAECLTFEHPPELVKPVRKRIFFPSWHVSDATEPNAFTRAKASNP